MRAVIGMVLLTGCLVEPVGGVPTGTGAVGCVDAADCAADQFCALDSDVGSCVTLPEACGPVGDCEDPACAAALEALCPDGQTPARCANPIDADREVVGNPSFTCG